jgi:hypothetical protein
VCICDCPPFCLTFRLWRSCWLRTCVGMPGFCVSSQHSATAADRPWPALQCTSTRSPRRCKGSQARETLGKGRMKRGEARPLSYSNVCIYLDVPLCACTCRSSMNATALCRSLRVGSVWSTVGSRSCLIPKLQGHTRPDVNNPDHRSLSIRLSTSSIHLCRTFCRGSRAPHTRHTCSPRP